MSITRTFDLLQKYKDNYFQKEDALAGKVNGQWVKYSSVDYINNSNFISYGLLALGIKKGDKIATISNNRPEWNFIDLGMAQTGAIHVPIFTSLDKEGYKIILTHAEVKFVFVSDKSLSNKISSLVDEIATLEKVYSFDDVPGIDNWKAVLELGKQNEHKFKTELEIIKSEIIETDAVTLIYTSGTTGNSKGVLLSHRNLISNAKSASEVFHLQPHHRYLSILPICHVGERMGNYQSQYSGCSIYYAESLGSISSDLLDIKPHGFGAVPRILEKVYDKIIDKGEKLSGIKRKLFFWAINIGLQYKVNGENGMWYELKLKLANKIVFSKWREAMGGNIISIGVGGAALQPRLERVFWAAGIKLLNMYGLTETSPIITIHRETSPLLKLGTVGAVIDNVELKIAADGEILCKGSNVMIGYYKDDEATKLAIDKDGWFYTGDIGVLEDGKFLRITDRKKELFKLSNGKYVSPQAIENLFKESVFIDQLMVIGEGEKFTSAIISPDFDSLKKWCRENKINASDKEQIIKEPQVIAYYNSIVNEFNRSLGSDEKVKRLRLVGDMWSADSGELSPTLKLKRRVIMQKYSTVVAEIFSHNEVLG